MSGSIGSGGGFDYNQVLNSMGQNTSAAESNLSSFSATMNPNSSADMIKMQQLTQQWTTALSLQSTTMKMVGDALKGIVQKIG